MLKVWGAVGLCQGRIALPQWLVRDENGSATTVSAQAKFLPTFCTQLGFSTEDSTWERRTISKGD